MKRNDFHEETLQHGKDHIRVRFFPKTGLIYMRKVNLDGTTVPNSQELIDIGEYPGLECLHDGIGWYAPLFVRLLRIYDDEQEGDTLPYFVHRHYAKGRSLV